MTRSTLKIATTLLAGGLLLAACGGSDSATDEPAAAGDSASAKGKTVCFVTAAAAHFYVTPFNETVEEEAKTAGVKLNVLSAEFDVQKGAEQLNQCVSQKADVIMLWPLDPAAYIPGLNRAKNASIPVVLVNSPMTDEALKLLTTFTGPDTYTQGKTSAESMTKALGGSGGNVVVLAGQAGNGTTIGRTDGFVDAIGDNIKVLATVNADFDQQKALIASRDLLTKYGEKIDGVYAQDDAMAIGFASAYKEAGISKKMVLLGIGGNKEAFELIKAGDMYGTILQSPSEDGRLAIQTAVKILEGEKVEKRLPLEMPVVTPDTIDGLEPGF